MYIHIQPSANKYHARTPYVLQYNVFRYARQEGWKEYNTIRSLNFLIALNISECYKLWFSVNKICWISVAYSRGVPRREVAGVLPPFKIKKNRPRDVIVWVNQGKYNYTYIYILFIWYDFSNMIFKINYNLYIATSQTTSTASVKSSGCTPRM